LKLYRVKGYLNIVSIDRVEEQDGCLQSSLFMLKCLEMSFRSSFPQFHFPAKESIHQSIIINLSVEREATSCVFCPRPPMMRENTPKI
jgi:hypothetical protein